MNANQSFRADSVPARLARLRDRTRAESNVVAVFAGDIRTQRELFSHSRVHQRAVNRVLANRCTDQILLQRLGVPFDGVDG